MGVRSHFPVDSSTLLDLVTKIYESALDPSLWPQFLDGFSDAVHSGAASLIVHDHSLKRGHIRASTRFDPVFQQEYDAYYASVNVWKNQHVGRYATGNIINSSALCSGSVLERTEFYVDFLRRANIYYSAGPVIYREGPLSATLSTQRSKDKGPFEREEQVFRLLAPHLERALRIHKAIGHAAASADALAAVPLGVVLLDAALRVSFVNERGRTILNRADGLWLDHGKILAAVPAESRRLNELLCAAALSARGLSVSPGDYLSVSQPSGESHLQLLISPVRMRFLLDPYAPLVLILIGGGPQRPVSVGALAALFALTPREASLVAILVRGLNLQAAARQLHMSYGTARWHLKTIFQKTGTKRQSELVRLVMGSVAQTTFEAGAMPSVATSDGLD